MAKKQEFTCTCGTKIVYKFGKSKKTIVLCKGCKTKWVFTKGYSHGVRDG